MSQLSLAGCDLPWVNHERIVPTSGRPLTLRYNLVRTEAALRQMVDLVSASLDLAHDTETSGMTPALGARTIGHALACQTDTAEISCWYVPIRHLLTGDPQLPVDEVSSAMSQILMSPGRASWAHAKFDWSFLAADGIQCSRSASDVLVKANIADENEPSFALKKLADKYVLPGARAEEHALDDWMRKDARSLGLKYKKRPAAKIGEVDTLGEPTYLERFGYSRTPVSLCGKYACRDVFYTLYLDLVTYRYVPQYYWEVYQREMLVAQRLFGMEQVGLPVAEKTILDVREKIGKQVVYWLAEVRNLAGDPAFDPTDQNIRQMLYGTLGLSPVKYTKEKKPSVDFEARKILANKYPEHKPLLDALGNLQDASKYHTTYSGNFLKYLCKRTGRIYPTYNQLEKKDRGGVPVTGRLSSANPNMQNIAGKPFKVYDLADLNADPEEISIRDYFVVNDGWIRAYIDFSQIELRVLAWFSQDPNLIRAYQEDLDIHQMTADLLGIKRSVAKQVNFGNSYGMTEIGLALRMPGYFEDPEGTIQEAKKVLDAFFARYRSIKDFEARFAAKARRNGNQFKNPFGRPRRIPWLSSTESWQRRRAVRQMMSSIISGTAADLMKECMIKSTDILDAYSPDSQLVQSVHDELVFDLRNQPGWTNVLASIIRMMEDWPMFSASGPDGFGQGVPIKVSCELTTTTWGAKKEVTLNDDNTFSIAA